MTMQVTIKPKAIIFFSPIAGERTFERHDLNTAAAHLPSFFAAEGTESAPAIITEKGALALLTHAAMLGGDLFDGSLRFHDELESVRFYISRNKSTKVENTEFEAHRIRRPWN